MAYNYLLAIFPLLLFLLSAQIEKSTTVINAVYGDPKRLALLAEDLIAHWEIRSTTMRPLIEGPGKALIVCGTREICARMYAAIVALRPDWHSDELATGKVKARTHEWLWAFALLYLALASQRNVPLFVIGAAPLAARGAQALLVTLSAILPTVRWRETSSVLTPAE